MPSVTTAGSGNWNSTTNNAPWPGGTIPPATDTIIIANGHTLTVPGGYTAECGDPANAATVGLRTAGSSGTGMLVVNGILHCFSSLQSGNVRWQINAGGQMLAANTTGRPNFQIGDAANLAANPALVFRGALGNRAVVSRVSGALGWNAMGMTGASLSGSGLIDSEWGLIEHVVPAVDRSLVINPSATQTVRFVDTLIRACGPIGNSNVLPGGASLVWERSAVREPAQTLAVRIICGQGADVTGLRQITDCVFEGEFRSSGVSFPAGNATQTGWDVTNSVFYTTVGSAITITPGVMKRWINNLIIANLGNDNSRPIIPFATDAPNERTTFINIKTHASIAIDGIMSSPRGTAGGTWRGAFLENARTVGATSSDDNFVFELDANTAQSGTFTYENVVIPPTTGNGAHGGCGVVIGGPNNSPWPAALRLIAQRFTQDSIAGSNGIVTIEHSPLVANQNCIVVRDSILFAASTRRGGSAVTRVPAIEVASITANNNWGWRVTGDRYNGGVDIGSPEIVADRWTTTPGTGDQTGDPQFVDDQRRFLGYAQRFDAGITTYAAAFAAYANRLSDSAWDSAFNVTDTHNWLMGGFAPNNASVGTASSTGGTVGAVDVIVGGKSLTGNSPLLSLTSQRLARA